MVFSNANVIVDHVHKTQPSGPTVNSVSPGYHSTERPHLCGWCCLYWLSPGIPHTRNSLIPAIVEYWTWWSELADNIHQWNLSDAQTTYTRLEAEDFRVHPDRLFGHFLISAGLSRGTDGGVGKDPSIRTRNTRNTRTGFLSATLSRRRNPQD